MTSFSAELGQRNPGQDSERRNAVLSRQKLITWLEEQFATLPEQLRDLPEDDLSLEAVPRSAWWRAPTPRC